MSVDPNDPRLTTYALGAMNDAEKLAFEAELAGADHGEVTNAIAATGAELEKALQAEPLSLDASRREAILQAAAASAVATAPELHFQFDSAKTEVTSSPPVHEESDGKGLTGADTHRDLEPPPIVDDLTDLPTIEKDPEPAREAEPADEKPVPEQAPSKEEVLKEAIRKAAAIAGKNPKPATMRKDITVPAGPHFEPPRSLSDTIDDFSGRGHPTPVQAKIVTRQASRSWIYGGALTAALAAGAFGLWVSQSPADKSGSSPGASSRPRAPAAASAASPPSPTATPMASAAVADPTPGGRTWSDGFRSGFSLRSRASGNTRVEQSLGRGALPDPSDVDVRALIDYSAYDYQQQVDDPTGIHLEMGPAPWEPRHRLLRVGIHAPSSSTVPEARATVTFDPSTVTEWKLLGQGRPSDPIQGETLAAGETTTVIYELTFAQVAAGPVRHVADVEFAYAGHEGAQAFRAAANDDGRLLDSTSDDFRFAVGSAAFGLWLGKAPAIGRFGLDDVSGILKSSAKSGTDARRNHVLQLVDQARAASPKP